MQPIYQLSFLRIIKNAEVAQLVERQPSKLNVAGSNPVFRSKVTLVGVAFFRDCRYSSAVERFLGKEEVSGSSPDNGSKQIPEVLSGFFSNRKLVFAWYDDEKSDLPGRSSNQNIKLFLIK